MSFSEKMRESLGAGGVGLNVSPLIEEGVPVGGRLEAMVTLEGGTTSAHVDGLVLRLIEADRHWRDSEGAVVLEEDAQQLDDRRHLTAGWERRTVAEVRVNVDEEVADSGSREVTVALDVPAECSPSTISCAHTLNVQADIKGQIDPTGNARIRLQPA